MSPTVKFIIEVLGVLGVGVAGYRIGWDACKRHYRFMMRATRPQSIAGIELRPGDICDGEIIPDVDTTDLSRQDCGYCKKCGAMVLYDDSSDKEDEWKYELHYIADEPRRSRK